MAEGTGIDWQKMIPELIGAGASAGGQIYGARTAAKGYEKAGQIQAQTAQQQLNALLGMYGVARGERAPHRAVGVNALNTLQNWKPGGQNAFAPVDLSKYRSNTVDLPPELRSLTSGGAGGNTGNVFSPSGTGTPGFSDLSTKGIQSRGSRVLSGALGGAGLGATGAGLGNAFLGGANSLTKFSMPWMAGAGAAVGAVKGLFDNDNADQNFATKGIQRVSDYTWNQLVPQVKAGQVSPEEAEQQFNQVWANWENSMRQTPGFNKDVIEQSIASQRQYFSPFFQEMQRLKGGQPVVS